MRWKNLPILKTVAQIVIFALTIGAFWYYLANNPEIIDQLLAVSPISLVALVLLYGLVLACLILVTRISLRLFDKTMGKEENVLFNSYSMLINFFGPGQSGPAFRAIYLKKRHGLAIRRFALASLIYYAFYAIISGFLMFVGKGTWWQTLLVVVMIGGVSLVVIKWYMRRKHYSAGTNGFNLINIALLFGAVLLQIAALVAIYAIELNEADASASFGQVLSYTGVANFSLFVSLTPGAIGIREAFLLFSQDLHHIGSGLIVAASIIDRAVYLLFLGLVALLAISLHAKERLRISDLKS